MTFRHMFKLHDWSLTFPGMLGASRQYVRCDHLLRGQEPFVCLATQLVEIGLLLSEVE